MKRYGNIWETFCSTAHAAKAIELGTVNKRTDNGVRRKLCYDTDDPAMRSRLDPEKVKRYARHIVSLLENGWQHSPTKQKVVIPPRGKRRNINCPTLDDHIIHWMLILAIKQPLRGGGGSPEGVCRSGLWPDCRVTILRMGTRHLVRAQLWEHSETRH